MNIEERSPEKLDYGAKDVNLTPERSQALIRLQGELMARAIAVEEDTARAGMEWARKYSDPYRKLLDLNSELLTEFMNASAIEDKEEKRKAKEKAIQHVEQRLYSDLA